MAIDPNLLAQLLASGAMYRDPQVSQLPGPMADAQSQGMSNTGGQSPEMMPALNYGQPHQGYMSRLAAALAAHPLVVGPAGPHTSPWDTFGSNLLASAGNAMGAHSASQQHDQALRQAYAQQQALAYNQQQSAQAIERQRLLGILGAAGIRASSATDVQGLRNTGAAGVADIGAKSREKVGAGNNETAITVAQIRAAAPRGSGTAASQDDVSAIVEAIARGDQPPVLTGLYRNNAAVRAGLAKRGVNLSRMQSDWAGLQRHYASLNGPVQLRLQQAAQNAKASIEYIGQLNDDLSRMAPRFAATPLNRLGQTLIANGIGTPEAAAAVTKLQGQIAATQLELANVYEGGGAPHEQAIGMAKRVINDGMSPVRIKAGLEQAGRDVGIRYNAMGSAGAISPSNPASVEPSPNFMVGPNPMPIAQAPSQAKGGTVRMYDPLTKETRPVPFYKVEYMKQKHHMTVVH